jgi:ribosomal protein S18 acetylase RimI-like enzyme
MSSPPSYHLRPATISDLSSIGRIWTSAFFDDEIIGHLMHPHRAQYPNDVYWFLLRGIRERFWNWRHQFIVVTILKDGKERIVGAADWRRLGNGGSIRSPTFLHPGNLIAPLFKLHHTISLQLFPNRAANPSQSSFLSSAVANSEKYWTGERAECWDLHVCGVDPEFQGRGVGKMLASWGVREAEKERDVVVASVLCGEKNRGFYGKAGFGMQVGGGEKGIVLFTR